MLDAQQNLRFDCAVVYDATLRKYYEYEAQNIRQLLKRLLSADEIITVNGSGCDLPVLEQVCGRQAIRPLWSVHRDLHGWHGCFSLEQLSNKLLPGDWAGFEVQKRRHFERLRAAGLGDFHACKLAKCRTDVEYTAAVMRELPDDDPWRNEDERG